VLLVIKSVMTPSSFNIALAGSALLFGIGLIHLGWIKTAEQHRMVWLIRTALATEKESSAERAPTDEREDGKPADQKPPSGGGPDQPIVAEAKRPASRT
jgi:hypothetical protein